MKTLLAMDGSDHSYEALRALKYMSRADQLIVLHVLKVPRPAYPMMMPEVADELYSALERSMREDGERLLDRVQSLLPLHAGPSNKRLEVGSPADIIISVAEQEKVDLIVMGARGVGPIRERLLGSVSHRVVAAAPCAKLIVNAPMKAMKKLFLPLQGASDLDAAVRFLQLKPFHEPVEVSLLTVLPSVRPPWPVEAAAAEQLEDRALQSGRDFIESAVARIQSLGFRVQGRAKVGNPVDTILHEAAAEQVDLIVMGTRGRTGVTRFVLGSVSHAVLHRMPCPVLVFQ